MAETTFSPTIPKLMLFTRLVFIITILLLAAANVVLGFRNRWALLSGDLSLTYKPPVFGAKGTASANFGPGGLLAAATAIDSLGGELWLYGGQSDVATPLDNLWKFRLNDSSWTWVSGSGGSGQSGPKFGSKGVPSASNKPPALVKSVMWFDPLANELWLFGGWMVVGTSNNYYNTLWRFRPNDTTWTWMGGSDTANAAGIWGTRNVADTNNIPSSRTAMMHVFDPDTRTTWLVGGFFYATGSTNFFYNDVWRFRHNDSTWTWLGGSNSANPAGIYGIKGVSDATNSLPPRIDASIWFDPWNNSIWVFGGVADFSTRYDFYNDMWKFNLSTNEWTWVSGPSTANGAGDFGSLRVPAPTNNPQPLYTSSYWIDRSAKELWNFGGRSVVSSVRVSYNTLWRYSLLDSTWTWMGGGNTPNQPGSAEGILQASASFIPLSSSTHAFWSDSYGSFWIYGGRYELADGFATLSSFWYLRKYIYCEDVVIQINATTCAKFVDGDSVAIPMSNDTALLPYNDSQCYAMSLAILPFLTCVPPRMCFAPGACLVPLGGPCNSSGDCFSQICERPGVCCRTMCQNGELCDAQGNCMNQQVASPCTPDAPDSANCDKQSIVPQDFPVGLVAGVIGAIVGVIIIVIISVTLYRKRAARHNASGHSVEMQTR